MIWTDNPTGHARLGLIVPRFRRSAVARNRVRRRLKEIWRRDVRPVQPAWDLVVRARQSAYDATFESLRTQFIEWRDRAVAPPVR
jgi:ribonuclease P protein component